MPRCKHENITITEYGRSSTWHHRECKDGRWFWMHDSDFGDYAGKILVCCRDCGFQKEYTKNRPKWVQKHFEQATTERRNNYLQGISKDYEIRRQAPRSEE